MKLAAFYPVLNGYLLINRWAALEGYGTKLPTGSFPIRNADTFCLFFSEKDRQNA